ncbi:MAG: carboxypeptidase-like regulatory domain-containing protein [Flammeovirgaceae bacterium]|nr:carboxypeptidase-like regulatory domain-containing protein [Flammeovirgaceae bacterium]
MTWGQTGQVSGRILDSQTLEPLPFANVFINNTTIGTASDMNGEFLLPKVPIGTNEIIFPLWDIFPIKPVLHL